MTSKYDDIAQRIMEQTGAECVAVVVVHGSRGNGFCIKARAGSPLAGPRAQAGMLRFLADYMMTEAPDGVTLTQAEVPEPKGDA